ncbi:MAG: glycosyltransferase family 2 protein [Deltaproteobacteria bacterium]|nr:glycosyltransferase family 2 protein [Deltaproteobacteria bacterium]
MTASDPAARPPALTIGVPASVGEDDLPATLVSLAASAAGLGAPFEVVVAVNGPDEPAPAAVGAEAFARRAGLALVPPGAAPPAAGSCVRVLRLVPRSKTAAWNAIRAAARAPVIVFADADVRVVADALPRLVRRLEASPELAIVAGREEPLVTPADGLVARVAALPHRFDFGNVPGRLYALRTAALPEPMPASVLHEDAYLSVRLGRARFAKEPGAVVRLRPPTTWSEYLHQRIRNEVGKLQLVREFPDLHRAHGFGVYPWRRFVREIAPREYPLVALSMAARVYARACALRRIRRGFDRGWSVLPSTKRWPAAGGGAGT